MREKTVSVEITWGYYGALKITPEEAMHTVAQCIGKKDWEFPVEHETVTPTSGQAVTVLLQKTNYDGYETKIKAEIRLH